MITFYGYFRSSAAYRCRIALNLKGLEHESRFVHLRKGEQSSPSFLAVNPQGLVPALQVGDAVLTQSLAIVEWLEETYPEPPLLPRDALERARVRAFALAIACDIHPLQNLRVLKHLKKEFGQDQDGLDAWCRRWLSEGLTACERLVSDAPAGQPYAFGDTPGLADIFLVPQMFSAARFGVGLQAMPRLRAIHAACEEHPAFAKARPSVQPDAEE